MVKLKTVGGAPCREIEVHDMRTAFAAFILTLGLTAQSAMADDRQRRVRRALCLLSYRRPQRLDDRRAGYR